MYMWINKIYRRAMFELNELQVEIRLQMGCKILFGEQYANEVS